MSLLNFRAWHKKEQKMYSSTKLDIDYTVEGDSRAVFAPVAFECDTPIKEIVSHDPETDDPIYEKHLVIMSSTGLTDKNGIEIFESDVVRGSDGVCVQVVWDRGSFVFSGEGVKRSFDAKVSLWLAHPEFVEIIGNIWEHPSLLK